MSELIEKDRVFFQFDPSVFHPYQSRTFVYVPSVPIFLDDVRLEKTMKKLSTLEPISHPDLEICYVQVTNEICGKWSTKRYFVDTAHKVMVVCRNNGKEPITSSIIIDGTRVFCSDGSCPKCQSGEPCH